MDGLSVAASIVGIVSLAMQLGQTTRKLIGFLDTITDAPNEVIRLNDLLKLIFAVSAGVVNALEHQRRHQGDGASGREHICEVLIVCLRKLTSIQDIVDRSERLQSGGSRTSRGWAKFKLALKRDEILELERQLGQALSVLNVLLTTSVMHDNAFRVTESTSSVMSTHSLSSPSPNQGGGHNELHNGPNSSPDLQVDKIIDSSKRPKIDTSMSQQYICLGNSFSASYKRRTRKQVVRDSSTEEARSEVRKETFEISLSFLSSSIDLVVSRLSSCSPSLGLRVQHIISMATWQSHIYHVMDKDDVDGFRKLVRNGLCTLDSCRKDGITMLEIAEAAGWTHIASDLRSQGCELSSTSAWYTLVSGGKARNGFLPPSRFRSISHKLDLVEYDPEDIIPRRDKRWPINGSSLLEAFEWFASTGSHETALPLSDYLGSLLCLVCSWWGILDVDGSRERLNLLVSGMISRGGNVHHLDRLGGTPLQSLIRYMPSVDDSFFVTKWLSLLDDGLGSLPNYVETECQICPGSFETFLQDSRGGSPDYVFTLPRMITMSMIEGNLIDSDGPKITWVDPSSTAVEVLREFTFQRYIYISRSHNCDYMRYWFDLWRRDPQFVPMEGRSIRDIIYQWITEQGATPEIDSAKNQYLLPRPDEVQSAIDTGKLDTLTFARLVGGFHLCHCDLTGKYLELWPFNGNTHTMCQSGNLIGRACLDQSTWCPMHCCRFNHERFERKQKKKWMKRMGIKTIKVPRVPGGWVE